MVFIHGGGWAVGDLATYDELCARLAIASQSVVFSVDYRRAPEEPFPAAVQDSEAATRWLLDQAKNLGINSQRVVIAGDSAGGNLAAVVARRLRDHPPSSGVCLLGQLLIYPITDGRMNSASYAQFSIGYGLTKRRMEWYWDMYCPDPDQRGHPDASPILAAELDGIPPMVVVVATHDPLHDEAREYADAALAAGVQVEVLEAKGQLHGFIRCTGIIDEAIATIDRLGVAVVEWAATAAEDSNKQALAGLE
ncbi:alpha/beta hydrolase [Arthrobacter sp. NPDC056493]|uniref:alpha/beta hydrolase n=1 Tax=Arthrobacter sp. NPDC056493 TaxID=3345839 RepID=UPI0036722B0C